MRKWLGWLRVVWHAFDRRDSDARSLDVTHTDSDGTDDIHRITERTSKDGFSSFAVGKGHERTAREAGPVGFSIKNAIWLTKQSAIAEVGETGFFSWIVFGERSCDAESLGWIGDVSVCETVELRIASGLVVGEVKNGGFSGQVGSGRGDGQHG